MASRDTILATLVVVKLVTAKSVSSRLYIYSIGPTGPVLCSTS
jgi:hypothetical protein